MSKRAIATAPGKQTEHKTLTLKEKTARIQEEADNIEKRLKEEYARKRRAEYPSIEDQLDLMYHSGFEAWKTKIELIKTKYPKDV